MFIYFDLETIPSQQDWIKTDIALHLEERINNLKAPGNYKKEEAIDKWHTIEAAKLRQSADEEYKRCALDGGRGEIISVAWAVNDSPVDSVIRGPEDDAISERELLAQFFDALGDSQQMRGAQWIGHNILGFDLPFLYKRCVILGYRPAIRFPVGAKPWGDSVFDTMIRWAGMGGRIKQDDLCKMLGLPGKPEGIDGSTVYSHWLNGDIDLIDAYNRSDVETVRAMHHKMTFKELL